MQAKNNKSLIPYITNRLDDFTIPYNTPTNPFYSTVAEKRFESIDREAALRLRFHEPSDISCSPLNPADRGYLVCADGESTTTTTVATPSGDDDSNEDDVDDVDDEDEVVDDNEEKERTPIRPGTKCRLKCPRGYELRGEYELTCRADGTWDGPKHGECLRKW